eukprot:6807242-Pyramimonas_sp.AAC.1
MIGTASRRPRQTANPNVREHHYADCIKRFIGRQSLTDKLGALVDDPHKIEPFHIACASNLMESLIDAGLSNGVMIQSRFEWAVKSVLQKCSELLASRIADHVRLCFSMVRQWKLDMEMIDGRARSKKSSPFRRKCTAADIVIVENLVAKLKFTAVDAATETTPVRDKADPDTEAKKNYTKIAIPDTDLQSSTSLAELFRTGSDVDLESLMDGLDAICGAGGESDVASTIWYPEESPRSAPPATPRVTIPPAALFKFSGEAGPEDIEADSSDDGIPDPCSRRRKLGVLQARKEMEQSQEKYTPPKQAAKKNKKGTAKAVDKITKGCNETGKVEGNGSTSSVSGEKLYRAILSKTKDPS